MAKQTTDTAAKEAAEAPDLVEAAPKKRKVILQRLRTVQANDGAGEGNALLDFHEDILICNCVPGARKKRKQSGYEGIFRIIEVLDEFKVAHEQSTKEVITRNEP